MACVVYCRLKTNYLLTITSSCLLRSLRVLLGCVILLSRVVCWECVILFSRVVCWDLGVYVWGVSFSEFALACASGVCHSIISRCLLRVCHSLIWRCLLRSWRVLLGCIKLLSRVVSYFLGVCLWECDFLIPRCLLWSWCVPLGQSFYHLTSFVKTVTCISASAILSLWSHLF